MPKALYALALLALAPSVPADETADFYALLETAWEYELDQSPVFASYLGDRRANDEWDDRGLEAINARQVRAREFLTSLNGIARSRLSGDDQLNYDLFRRQLVDDIDSFRFKTYLLPFRHRGGVQALQSWTRMIPQETVQDYDDWLARMARIDEVVEQTIALAEEGRRQGYTAPRILMQRVPPQIASQVVDSATDSPFYAFFADLPPSFSDEDRERLEAAAVETIEKTVVPAYRRLARYVEDTYLPACRESIGLSELPNGSDWYEYLAQSYTTTSMTPAEIHRLGLNEVRRIRDEMLEVIDEIGFDGDFAAFLEFLRTDPKFYYETADDLHNAYLATAKRIDPELVKLFGKLPRMPYGVKPIPAAIAPDTSTAYYTEPAADGSRAGIFWVNLYRPDVRPTYEIEVLTVHEAMPGHHLQLALQQELDDVPAFRRNSDFTAFVEGWGLYSESLGPELGLYQDPYSRFGALTYEMWRAVRLVVDTGIHYRGWTRQQAIDFFTDNAAKSEHDIVNEIDRYIATPGQALAYKIGQLKILELRAEAEATLGDQFDVRAFHDQLLGAGALPLDILETRMDAWVRSQIAGGG